MKKLFAILGVAALLGAGCDNRMDDGAGSAPTTDTNAMTEVQTGRYSANTNLPQDETATAPGAGASVGADPSGAGTAPLREQQDTTDRPQR